MTFVLLGLALHSPNQGSMVTEHREMAPINFRQEVPYGLLYCKCLAPEGAPPVFVLRQMARPIAEGHPLPLDQFLQDGPDRVFGRVTAEAQGPVGVRVVQVGCHGQQPLGVVVVVLHFLLRP